MAGLFAFSCATDSTEDLGVNAGGNGLTTFTVSLEDTKTHLGEKNADGIQKIIGAETLHFFDACSPIVEKDSIDFTKAYYKSRYEEGDDSYINCAMNKEEYETFMGETHILYQGSYQACKDFIKV